MSPFFIALTLTDVLLLALLIAPRLAWWAKITAIVVVLAFNFLSWSSVDSGVGWPVSSELPANALFLSCEVIEPDEATQEAGRIFVWEIPLDFKHGVLAFRPSGAEPRAYSVAYDRSLHEACAQSSKATAQGQRAGIRARSHKHGHGHGLHGQPDAGKYRAYILPNPPLPTKEAH
jgi:hypothetical protein